jgi:hypothetical protein
MRSRSLLSWAGMVAILLGLFLLNRSRVDRIFSPAGGAGERDRDQRLAPDSEGPRPCTLGALRPVSAGCSGVGGVPPLPTGPHDRLVGEEHSPLEAGTCRHFSACTCLGGTSLACEVHA